MCTTCQCSHESLKSDEQRWQTLTFVAVQTIDYGDGEKETFEIRNTLTCKSTLYKSLGVEVAS